MVRTDFNEPHFMAFLRKLYASTRGEEMAAVDWPPQQVEAFLIQQFDCQHKDYTARYKRAKFYLIHQKGTPCGRIYWYQGEEEIRIIDISLLPEFRGRGIGTLLLNHLKEGATKQGIPLTLHVGVFNPCQRLYQRLGFVAGDSDGIYTFMKFTPESAR